MGYEIDFLPVGDEGKSGDAITLRFGNLHGDRDEQLVVVVDGGFASTGEKVVEHVRTHYGTDRVDLAVLTHPDSDHANGLKVVVEEMDVRRLWMHRPWLMEESLRAVAKSKVPTRADLDDRFERALSNAYELDEIAEGKGIPVDDPFLGAQIGGNEFGGRLFVVGPSRDYYVSLIPQFGQTVSRSSALLEGIKSAVAGVAEAFGLETLSDDDCKTSASNNSSAVLLLSVGERQVLLTADAGIEALTNVADVLDATQWYTTDNLGFIQVPHHGSRRNVGPTILDRLLGPKLSQESFRRSAFVSAAVNGEPKHPSRRVTNAFRRRGSPVVSTQGKSIWHYHNAPARAGWGPVDALPFYPTVEDVDD